MNSRTVVGEKGLILKEDHGFALGVREMNVFTLSPHNYMLLRNKSQLKLSRDVFLGQAFHAMLLQGRKQMQVSCQPAGVYAYKPLTFFSHTEGNCVSPADMWRLERMLRNFYGHPEVQELFLNALMYKICSGLFVDRDSGCECFFNADFILPERGCVIDVKTCRNTEHGALDDEIARFKYHWQAWWAKTGAGHCLEMPITDFIFIFVGQNAPFNVVLRRASADMLDCAQEEVAPYMKMYREFFEDGSLVSGHALRRYRQN